VKLTIAFAIAAVALGGARIAKGVAAEHRGNELTATPYAPTPNAAPFVSVGFRELAADLLYVRMVGYFAAYDSTPSDTGAVAEAIVALDPQLRRTYEFGATALTDARRPPERSLQMRAIALLDRGMLEFPDYWKLANLAGQIYLVELQTDDPAQRRAWDEKGTLLLESASRKPGAPAGIGVFAAQLQSKLGQKERAIRGLTEILLITHDTKARQEILTQLAKINNEQSEELAAELLDARRSFERSWKRERPAVTATFYVLLGPPLGTTFDLTTLATGGRDLIGTQAFERLEPITDPPTTPAP